VDVESGERQNADRFEALEESVRRRELLQLGAGAVAWGTVSIARADSVPEFDKVLVVEADVDRWGHAIKPAGYGWVKVSSKDTGGGWAMFESQVVPGTGVPLHVHHHQEEWFQVLAGEFLFDVGGEQHRLTTGMSILGPRQVAHRFKNTGPSVGTLLILAQPAGTLEECFAEIAQLPEGERRNPKTLATILVKHDIDVTGPPLP
jgi:mannose-6-phosphate isomerase-like protein (cupin superfamily)